MAITEGSIVGKPGTRIECRFLNLTIAVAALRIIPRGRAHDQDGSRIPAPPRRESHAEQGRATREH